MKIVFIGAGNLATSLAQELKVKRHKIEQIFSRTMESASELAAKVDSSPTNDLKKLIIDADLYIFSVKDSILEQLIQQMPFTSGIWVHTAGSIAMDIFKSYHTDYGVIYPFQTFSKSRKIDFSVIPVFVEASTGANLQQILSISHSISEKVIPLSSDKRKYVHLCGVFACNFVNYMYTISESILNEKDIPFDILLPLIDETAKKVHKISPKEAQTGPAVRYDENVINKHMSLLKDENQKAIYKLLTVNIHKTNK